ncbi:YiiX family permuted papain-like enzyme [Providencia stuartii]
MDWLSVRQLLQRRKLHITLLLCLLIIFSFNSALANNQYQPETGDIIFHTSRSEQSLAIQAATRSPYSHMGIILFKNDNPYVYEASNVVKFTPLKQWIKQGIANKYVIKRLKNPLTEQQKALLIQKAIPYQSKPYDLTFSWSDERIYCSELVWKIYKSALDIEVGHLQKLHEFDLSSDKVIKKLKERYGDNIPFDETVISPNAIFDSPLLMTVDSF